MTVATMARPGRVAIHQASSKLLRPSAIRLPHDGVGAGTPRPRKDRVASSSIVSPTRKAPSNVTGTTTAGNRYRVTTRNGEAPVARAAEMNSRSRTERVYPRTCRAAAIQVVAASTTTVVTSDGP